MNTQEASRFFTLPTELRHAIYEQLFNLAGHHLNYLPDEGGVHRFKLTPCTAPIISDDNYGNERGIKKYGPHHVIHRRRLKSVWGPHWLCEELANRWSGYPEDSDRVWWMQARDFCAALRVCRRLYLDITEFVTTMTEFHVNDLHTLKALRDVQSIPNFPSFESSIRPRISKLSVEMSRPLTFFRCLESGTCMSYIWDPPIQDFSTSTFLFRMSMTPYPTSITSGPPEDLTPWRELPAWLLVKLPELRKLQIWLDHSNRTNWTVVNERAILKPIAALKSNVPELEVVCLLPKLNPRIQSSERHYIRWMPGFVSDEVKEHEMKEDEVKDEVKDEAKEDKVGGPPNFELHRVLRQRMRVRTFNMGRQAIKTDWDFPFTFGLYEIGGMTVAEAEREEERMLKLGLEISVPVAVRSATRGGYIGGY